MTTVSRLLGRVESVVYAIARTATWVGVAALALALVLLVRESIGRTFFNDPSGVTHALTSVLVAMILYTGIAGTASSDGHIASDLFVQRMSPRMASLVGIVGNAAATLFGVLLGLQMLTQVERSMRNEASIREVWNLPVAVPQWILIGGILMFVVVCVLKLLRHVLILIVGHDDRSQEHESADVLALTGEGI